MKLTYIKGIAIFGLIVLLNFGFNKALSPKLPHNRYHYNLNATQLDLKKGALYSITATGKDAAKVHWLSSDDHVASVSDVGQVTAKNAGQTIITAKIHHESKDVIVNVADTAPQDVLIYNDSQTIAAASEAPKQVSIANFKMKLSEYNDHSQKPKVTITDINGTKLIQNKDYTLKYFYNKNTHTTKVIATGTGKYMGTLTQSVTAK